MYRGKDFQQAHWRPLKIRRLAPRPRGTHHDFCTQGHLGEEENIWEEKNSPEKAWECERDQVKILRWIIIKQNNILHCKWMIYLEGQKLELLKLFSVTEKMKGSTHLLVKEHAVHSQVCSLPPSLSLSSDSGGQDMVSSLNPLMQLWKHQQQVIKYFSTPSLSELQIHSCTQRRAIWGRY